MLEFLRRFFGSRQGSDPSTGSTSDPAGASVSQSDDERQDGLGDDGFDDGGGDVGGSFGGDSGGGSGGGGGD